MIQGSWYCGAVKFELLATRRVHQGGMRFAMAHRDQGIRLHDPPAAPSALRAFLRLPGVPHRRKSAERPDLPVRPAQEQVATLRQVRSPVGWMFRHNSLEVFDVGAFVSDQNPSWLVYMVKPSSWHRETFLPSQHVQCLVNQNDAEQSIRLVGGNVSDNAFNGQIFPAPIL